MTVKRILDRYAQTLALVVGLAFGAHALAQCSVYLALAPKSNASYKALGAARAYVREHGAAAPPGYLRSGPLAEEGYDYPHDRPNHVSSQSVRPPGLEDVRFYAPDGQEAPFAERWAALRKLRGLD